MSKQVVRQGDSLIVRTREDYLTVNKVICLHKGSKDKEFFPFVPCNINDLSDVQNWTICGYRVPELVKLAMILQDEGIDDRNLRDFNETFILGYNRAKEEDRLALEKCVHDIIHVNEQTSP